MKLIKFCAINFAITPMLYLSLMLPISIKLKTPCLVPILFVFHMIFIFYGIRNISKREA